MESVKIVITGYNTHDQTLMVRQFTGDIGCNVPDRITRWTRHVLRRKVTLRYVPIRMIREHMDRYVPDGVIVFVGILSKLRTLGEEEVRMVTGVSEAFPGKPILCAYSTGAPAYPGYMVPFGKADEIKPRDPGLSDNVNIYAMRIGNCPIGPLENLVRELTTLGDLIVVVLGSEDMETYKTTAIHALMTGKIGNGEVGASGVEVFHYGIGTSAGTSRKVVIRHVCTGFDPEAFRGAHGALVFAEGPKLQEYIQTMKSITPEILWESVKPCILIGAGYGYSDYCETNFIDMNDPEGLYDTLLRLVERIEKQEAENKRAPKKVRLATRYPEENNFKLYARARKEYEGLPETEKAKYFPQRPEDSAKSDMESESDTFKKELYILSSHAADTLEAYDSREDLLQDLKDTCGIRVVQYKGSDSAVPKTFWVQKESESGGFRIFHDSKELEEFLLHGFAISKVLF